MFVAVDSSRLSNRGGDKEDELSNEESRLLLVELSLLTLIELALELLLVDNELDIFLVEKELKSKFLRG